MDDPFPSSSKASRMMSRSGRLVKADYANANGNRWTNMNIFCSIQRVAVIVGETAAGTRLCPSTSMRQRLSLE